MVVRRWKQKKSIISGKPDFITAMQRRKRTLEQVLVEENGIESMDDLEFFAEKLSSEFDFSEEFFKAAEKLLKKSSNNAKSKKSDVAEVIPSEITFHETTGAVEESEEEDGISDNNNEYENKKNKKKHDKSGLTSNS